MTRFNLTFIKNRLLFSGSVEKVFDAFFNEITHISKLGKKRSSDLIKFFQRGKEDGLKVFDELTKKGTIICKDSKKIISKIYNDIYITFRPISTLL